MLTKSEKNKIIKDLNNGRFNPDINPYTVYARPSFVKDQINDKSEGSVWLATLTCGHTVVTGSKSMDMVYFCKECTINNVNNDIIINKEV